MIGCHRNLWSPNQSLIISFHSVCVFFSSWKVTGSLQTFRIHDIWHLHWSKTSLYDLFQSILQNSLLKQHSISLEKIASRTSKLYSSLNINHIVLFHQFNMIQSLKIKLRNRSKILNHHIFTVIFPLWNLRMQSSIRHFEEPAFKFSIYLRMLSFQLLNLDFETFCAFIILLSSELLLLSLGLINFKLESFPFII